MARARKADIRLALDGLQKDGGAVCMADLASLQRAMGTPVRNRPGGPVLFYSLWYEHPTRTASGKPRTFKERTIPETMRNVQEAMRQTGRSLGEALALYEVETTHVPHWHRCEKCATVWEDFTDEPGEITNHKQCGGHCAA
jgi:hypothetical protein